MYDCKFDNPEWKTASAVPPELADATVIYRIQLDSETAKEKLHLANLNPDERELADKLKLPRKRRCFVATRSILKQMLARYIGISIEDLRIPQNEYGKPYTDGMEFNVSHSRDWALIALNRRRPIGVDVQYSKPTLDFDRITRRRYGGAERRQLESEPDLAARRDKFFAIWTRKEAYVKAHGTSFYDKMSSLDLPLGADRIDDADLGGSWEMRTFRIGREYWVSLCVHEYVGNIHFCRWN